SVDAHWLVPHFEKMLYDNALIARVGVHLWQATGDAEIRRVCEDTLDWVAREMTSPQGAFYSSLDADSEGHEGRFYVWDAAELRVLLGGGVEADALMAYWGVTAAGNFEGTNILHVARDAAEPPAGLPEARRVLRAARESRIRPARDEKVLASWNGLMLRAIAETARAFGEDRYRALAVGNAEFLFREMVRGDRVFRSHTDGVTRIPGFLEDHAAVALGALAVYELTFDRAWLSRARALTDATVRWFWDDDAGAFFDTASDHEELITRPRDITDNATPSGTSLTVELLLRLGDVLGEPELLRRANHVLETIAEPMARYPLAFGHALTASDIAVYGAIELAIVGTPDAPDFRALARAAGECYTPSLVMAGGVPASADRVALLADRASRDGAATAFLCRGFVCGEPVTHPAPLREQMRAVLTSAAERP
ncbi:MAG: hypothetical protein WD801_08575, partial [Gemmatimonadaceae bacterium]